MVLKLYLYAEIPELFLFMCITAYNVYGCNLLKNQNTVWHLIICSVGWNGNEDGKWDGQQAVLQISMHKLHQFPHQFPHQCGLCNQLKIKIYCGNLIICSLGCNGNKNKKWDEQQAILQISMHNLHQFPHLTPEIQIEFYYSKKFTSLAQLIIFKTISFYPCTASSLKLISYTIFHNSFPPLNFFKTFHLIVAPFDSCSLWILTQKFIFRLNCSSPFINFIVFFNIKFTSIKSAYIECIY